jgi:hypothetical protein
MFRNVCGMPCKILNVNEGVVDKKLLISVSKVFIRDLGKYFDKRN